MKLTLKPDTVFELFREMQGTDRYGALGPKVPNQDYDSSLKPSANPKSKKFIPFDGPNYLVFDDHKDAPPGFALRVGRRAANYLVDKRIAGRKLKIFVGLAAGKKGDLKPLSLVDARDRAWSKAQLARQHGVDPNSIAEDVEASELTLKQVWDAYMAYQRAKQPPIKPNSVDSLDKAWKKLADWEHRKVRLIMAAEVLDRFDLHAVTLGHRTAAEAMGRWATSAVEVAIAREAHNAHAAMRPPSLTYNPFTILRSERRYRSRKQLESDYKRKGIRNPLSFDRTVAPFVKAAWEYRSRNPVAADLILLTLLWGMRRGESATFQWRDRITDDEASVARWIDLKARACYVYDPKNRTDHEFPIAPCALALLKLRRADQLNDERWVFPTGSAQSTKPYLSDPSVAMKTIKENSGIAVIRGHDLRRTFGAACEKLGFSDRAAKRMLGHAVAGGDSSGRYLSPEWADTMRGMERVEELILSKAPAVFNALRPKRVAAIPDAVDVVVDVRTARASRRKAR